MRNRIIVWLTIFALLLTGCKPGPDVSVENGWIRAMPPGAKMTAAYGTIRNHTASTLELTTFSSNRFASVSLHRSVEENGISKMKPQNSILLEPDGSVSLEPGGLHLMLMRPQGSMAAGDSVELSLFTTDGIEFRVLLPVEAR